MNRWSLLEHKIYSGKSLDIHFDFLIEDSMDCLTWKFSKLPLLNQSPVKVVKQPNHRLIWLSRVEHELSENRGYVKRIDHGMYKKISNKLESESLRFILDGKLLFGLFEISNDYCRLSKNN